MSRVSGGGTRPPVDTPAESSQGAPKTGEADSKADLRSKEGIQSFRQAARMEGVPTKIVDRFEKAGPALEKTMQALAGKIKFTNADLAQVARAVAVFVLQNPNADRKTRARAFARAILKRKRYDKIFSNLDEADEARLEEMFDLIADQLDGSPVMAQLVDEVTEGARKVTAR
ncbi:MAG: hypothetical protein AAB426_09015 [Myxococcota bacterium]